MINFSNPPFSLWSQLSSLCFFLAGIYGDLLLIRLFCFLAYGLLLTNAIVGSPSWPDVHGIIGQMGLDTLLWSTVCLYVHGSSLVSLLLDERRVHLTEDEEALWRLLYRTAGLSKRLFQELFLTTTTKDRLTVLELESGKLIPTDEHFYIIYRGQVRLQVLDPTTGVPTRTRRILVSGEMFDLLYLGLMSADTIFSVGKLRCTSLTPVKLFQIPKHHMKQMAQHSLAKTAFQALLINNLSFAAESFINTDTKRSYMAEKNCDKVFRPLEEWELPPRLAAGSGRALENLALGHLFRTLATSMSPPWPLMGHPKGTRQTQLAPPPARKPRFSNTSFFRGSETEGSSSRSNRPPSNGSPSSLSTFTSLTIDNTLDDLMEVPPAMMVHSEEEEEEEEEYESTASA